jgi:hypothetical protein
VIVRGSDDFVAGDGMLKRIVTSTTPGLWMNHAIRSVASGELTQSGSNILGQFSLSGTPCAISAALSGTVSGSSLSITLNENGQLVMLLGSVSSDNNSASALRHSEAARTVISAHGWGAANENGREMKAEAGQRVRTRPRASDVAGVLANYLYGAEIAPGGAL